jgi:hypothetical protein
MFNPSPINLVKEMMKGQFLIGTLTQVLNKTYDDKINPQNVYKEILEIYKNAVGQCPTFELPTSFKTIENKGKNYFHEKFDFKYPLRMIWIITGRGEFNTFETKKLIGPGDVIMLPTGIPFFWRLTGNLKFITHI